MLLKKFLFPASVFIQVLLLLPVIASADQSLAIQSLVPGSTVPIGTQVTFAVVGSGFNAAISYTAHDLFTGSTVSNSNINSSGIFSWIPATADAGSHTIRISATDGTASSTSIDQVINVPAPAQVIIQNISSITSLYPQNTVFFSAVANGFTDPKYSVSDSMNGSSVRNTSINSVGGFSWTTTNQDIGSHTITVTVTDSLGHSATATLSLSVKASASISLSPTASSLSVTAGTLVTLSLVSTDFTNPTFSVTNSLIGNSMRSTVLDQTTGAFSWTPNANDLGFNVLKFSAYDSSGKSANVIFNLTVTAASTTAAVATPVIMATTTATSTAVFPPLYKAPTAILATTAHAGSIVPQTNAADPIVPSLPVNVIGDYTFTSNLSLGSEGPDVIALQILLAKLGFFSGVAIGTFGPKTKAAVINFQTSHGLEPVGNVGPRTRAVLNGVQATVTTSNVSSTTSSTTTGSISPRVLGASTSTSVFLFNEDLKIGSTGDGVLELQDRLISLGFLDSEPTGYFGILTYMAVKKFQDKHGFEHTGFLNTETRAALNTHI